MDFPDYADNVTGAVIASEYNERSNLPFAGASVFTTEATKFFHKEHEGHCVLCACFVIFVVSSFPFSAMSPPGTLRTPKTQRHRLCGKASGETLPGIKLYHKGHEVFFTKNMKCIVRFVTCL